MKRKRKVKKNSPIRRLIIIMAALALAFSVVFVTASLFGAMPFSGISARIRAYVLGDDGREFPVRINAMNTQSADLYDFGFYVLSDMEIKLYDFSGTLRLTKQHNYTSPAVSAGKYGVMVYDRSGTDYMLIKKYKVVKEAASKDGDILTARAGRSGNLAFSVRSGDATSMLYVTDRSGEDIFIWKCAYEHIVSVALSDNEKCVASASIGAKDGDVVSTVHIFGFDYSEPLFMHTFVGETVIRIKYLSDRLLYIFTDSAIYTVKRNKEIEQLKDFDSSELGFYSDSDNGVSALALTKYGSSNLCELYVCGRRGKTLFSKEIEADVSDVHTNGKYVFLLADDSVLVYNLKGELLNNIELQMKIDKLFGNSRYVYLCAPDKIGRVFTLGQEQERQEK